MLSRKIIFSCACVFTAVWLTEAFGRATTFDSAAESETTTCIAHVKINDGESFSSEAPGHSIFTVYNADIIESSNCGTLRIGDPIYFAAPGGVWRERHTQVNGIAIGAQEEAVVYLGDSSPSLGVPILLRYDPTRRAPPTEQAMFTCARSSADGPSLYWRNRVVIMQPSVPAESPVDLSTLVNAMNWAGDQWSSATAWDFHFGLGPATNQRWTGFDWSNKQKNLNVVTIRKHAEGDFYGDWLHATKALAITTVTYLPETGEILDADIELNAEYFKFTDCPEGNSLCVQYDLKNTLTHEYGHVLGLDHPKGDNASRRNSSMFEETQKGEIRKRLLGKGDISGVSYLYPNGKESGECFLVPRKTRPRIQVFQETGCNQSTNPRLTDALNRHCERSEAIQISDRQKSMDCFATLAMTDKKDLFNSSDPGLERLSPLLLLFIAYGFPRVYRFMRSRNPAIWMKCLRTKLKIPY